MAITAYIREIGRGARGARSLSEAQAHDLMSQVLDARVTDLEIGAFALAMRIKGESVDELKGFLAATSERCIALHTATPAVVLPSYNGSRRLPNLTALLAMLLAERGVPVLVHGPAHDTGRVTTAEIFGALDLPEAADGDAVAAGWQRRRPAFMRTEVLCPTLARLLDVRAIVGVRNSGHTVAKLLGGFGARQSLRVVNFTHPDYASLLAEFAAATAADALLMRGTEGEPVASVRRLQPLDVYLAGTHRPDLSSAMAEGLADDVDRLPPDKCDAAATAGYIRAIVAGEIAVPMPIAAQVACLVAARDAMTSPAAMSGMVETKPSLTGAAAR